MQLDIHTHQPLYAISIFPPLVNLSPPLHQEFSLSVRAFRGLSLSTH